ncbi:hypothetical protein D3C84_1160890 [compost metagenome]
MATGINVRKVLKIDPINALKGPVLCERAKRAQGGRSQEFVMVVNGHEAGLLSYECALNRSIRVLGEAA